MREWSVTADQPLSLCIAADARLSNPNYADDQIWELVLEGGEPSAIALQTTYGLRARSMRIFPGFVLDDRSVSDPSRFASPPIVKSILPNYLRTTFAPFSGLTVDAEYWVPESRVVAGRFSVRNVDSEDHNLKLRLFTLLRPGDNPQAMGQINMNGVTVLAGKTASIEPVVFLSGGAVTEPTAYPSLTVKQSLEPGSERSWTWVHAGYPTHKSSLEVARSYMDLTWEAELSKLMMVNSAMVDIETGEMDWDLVLWLSQKAALGSYIGPTRHLPHPSIVQVRAPDYGYSEKGDGADYGLSWGGQTAPDAYLNLLQIVAVAPELALGVIKNFISVQDPEGFIDWRPGMGGQRNGALSIPLLATLSWKLYQHTEDASFLRSIFPKLEGFIDIWFTKRHDRDQDGHPEWDHTPHSFYDNSPTFVRWHRWGQALDISKAETPAMGAYLLRECESMIQIAEVIDRKDSIRGLERRVASLSRSLDSSWSEDTLAYSYIDRDLHISVPGEDLGKGKGEFDLTIQRTFDPPVRLQVRSFGPESSSPKLRVLIHGKGRRGRSRVEKLTPRRFQWFWGMGTASSEKTYAEIEKVEIQGLSDDFETEISLADFTRQDQTALLPLWANHPSFSHAERLVQETLMDPERFWRMNGISACSAKDPAYAADNVDGSGGVWMLWNAMLGEGLVEYGFIAEAAELVRRLIEVSLHCLRTDKAFREGYHADEMSGLGERHHNFGIVPVHLFLETLGIRLITPQKIWLRAGNPFPWPVIVRWKGLTIECLTSQIRVTFPDGQQVEIEEGTPQLVEQLL